ncbi:MAG: spore coat protein U domain-containing protein [Burkholderiales bacterium]|nr:spore coat protein U domain-containing protein [Burkholderiales bacterium]
MKLKPVVVAAALALGAVSAQAAVSCTSVTSPGFTMNYIAGTRMSTQTYFTVTCTRTASGDPTFIDYTVAADNGLYNSGGNRARETISGTNYHVSYDTFANSGCTTSFASGGAARIADTITWSSSTDFTARSKDTAFWGCVNTTQTGMPAGQYDDTITLSLRTTGTTVRDTGTAAARIYAPSACSLTTPPGNVVFNYTAFGSASAANTTFRVTCTTLMPYTLSLDSPSGTVVGLDYALGLSASNAAGTGAAQTYTISGTMAAGQSGVCTGSSCTASNPHTVTVGY